MNQVFNVEMYTSYNSNVDGLNGLDFAPVGGKDELGYHHIFIFYIFRSLVKL